jgi:hypothetical protein
MASFFNLVLDTTAPAGVSITLAGGATYATSRDISAAIATSDTPTTGYQMKIWGDVDNAYNASIQSTEGASSWIAFSTSQAIRLSTGDGLKTVNVKIRDDVLNESSGQSDQITLDLSVPVITIQPGSPDVSKVSKQATKDTVTVVWQSDEALVAYEVAVVANGAAARGTGTVIGTTNGSTNVSGGALAANTDRTTTIKGADLEAASAGDGTKVIKVFGQDAGGNWSTA